MRRSEEVVRRRPCTGREGSSTLASFGELKPARLSPKTLMGLEEGGRSSGSGNVGAKVGRQSWNKAHWRSWRGRGVWAAARKDKGPFICAREGEGDLGAQCDAWGSATWPDNGRGGRRRGGNGVWWRVKRRATRGTCREERTPGQSGLGETVCTCGSTWPSPAWTRCPRATGGVQRAVREGGRNRGAGDFFVICKISSDRSVK